MTTNLLEELRIVSGLTLEKGNHCKALSEDIYREIGETVSWQSLRRVLGFVESKSKVSMSVLDIIGRYLGFDNYISYINSQSSKKVNVVSESSNYLLNNIYNIPLKQERDLNYHFVCRNISKSIYYQPDLISSFPNSLISNRSVQLYFISRFPLIDLLNRGFKRILIQYRLISDSDEVNVFVGSLLYLNSFKIGNSNEKWLNKFDNINVENLHPFVQGRYFGSKLLSANSEGNRNRLIKKIESFLSVNQIDGQFPYFIFTFIEYAIAAKQFELVKSLIRKYFKEENPFEGWVEYGYREVFKIFEFVAVVETGFIEDAKRLSEKISKKRVAFYFRKTYWLLYLHSYILIISSNEKQKEIENEINLIEQFLYPD